MADIFISYKTERRPAAEHLARILEAHGFSVWIDYEGLKPGEGYAARLEAKVKEARVVLVLWCALSVQSEWVAKEAGWAKARGSYVPVWIEDAALPSAFAGDHTLALTHWSGEPISGALRALIRTVEGRMRRQAVVDQVALDREQTAWERFGRQPLAKLMISSTPTEFSKSASASSLGAKLSDILPRPIYCKASDRGAYIDWYQASEALGRLPHGANQETRACWHVGRKGLLAGIMGAAYALRGDDEGIQRDDARAAKLFKFAADHGDENALAHWALMLKKGEGGLVANAKEAAKHLIESAKRGSFRGARAAAEMIRRGQGGLTPDPPLALSTLKAAADAGNSDSQCLLGDWLAAGEYGIAQDNEGAIHYWRLAKNAGHAIAAERLRARGMGA